MHDSAGQTSAESGQLQENNLAYMLTASNKNNNNNNNPGN